ncbi:hypothetical protein Tco_1227125 [Tanacetum coccineum]
METKSSPAKRKLPYDSNFQYNEAEASKKQHFQSSNMFLDVSMTNGDTHGLKLSHESNNYIHGSNLSPNVHCPSGTFSVVHLESSDTFPHLRTTTSKLPSDVAYLKQYPVGYEHEYTDTDNTPQSVNVGFNSNVKNNGINMSTPTLFDITNSSTTHLAFSSSKVDISDSFTYELWAVDAFQICLYEHFRNGYKLAAKRDLSDPGML